VIELTTDIGRSKTEKIENTTSVSSAVEIFSRKFRHFQGALTAFKLGSRALDQFAELIRLWSVFGCPRIQARIMIFHSMSERV
jgi:hypothetical protein